MGTAGWPWGRLDSLEGKGESLLQGPASQHQLSKPSAQTLASKILHFFPLLAKPTWGGHGPTIPNLTNLIPKAFHPLPKTGVAADTPSPSCRELLGQHYTETHYSADGTEIMEKPDIQVRRLWGEQFSHSRGVPPC